MAADGFHIRPAAAADLAGLLSLYRALNPDDPPLDAAFAEARFAAMLSNPGMSVLVGVENAELVATVTLAVMPNLTRGGASYALIENVVTAAGYRRRGCGRRLIDTALERAWAAGCYKVMLLTGSYEAATLRFYESCGFLQNKTGFQIRRPGL